MTEMHTDLQDREYLGDGVYASHDGYQIWLAVNHHANVVIALEPSVMDRLKDYEARFKAKARGDE
jgi:hypothetical protein